MNEKKRIKCLIPQGAPGERTRKGNQLKRQAQQERLRARYYSPLSHRLDPHERPPGSMTMRPRYEMNEFSCYDCMKPMKTGKQLHNHLNGRDHRNVVDYRERTEKGYVPDRGRSSCGAALPSRQHGQETRSATEIPRPGKRGDADYQDWFDECGFRDDHDRPVNPHMILPSLSYHIGLRTGRERPPNSSVKVFKV